MATKAAATRRTPGWVPFVVFVLFVVFVVLVGAGYSWWFSDERVIKNRLADVAATLSAPEHDTDIGRLARVARLRGYLAEDIHIRAGPAQEMASRDAVLALASRWILPPGGLTVEFVDLQVALDPGGAGASVYLTAKLSGRDPRTGEPTLDAREATVKLAKFRGDWVIASVETVETLQRP